MTRLKRATLSGLIALFHFALVCGLRFVFPAPYARAWELYWYTIVALWVLMGLESAVVRRGELQCTEGGHYIPLPPRKRIRVALNAAVCALVIAPFVHVVYSGPHLDRIVGSAIGRTQIEAFPALAPITLTAEQARATARIVLDRENKARGVGFELGGESLEHRDGRLQYLFPIEFGSLIHAMSAKTTPGYIRVWGTNPEMDAALVDMSTDGRMFELVYMPSAVGSTDVERRTRSSHPNGRLSKPRFMADHTGWPFWVTTDISETAFGNGFSVVGVVTIDAVSGGMIHFDSPTRPDWLQVVVPEEVARERLNWYAFYGKHQRNFLERMLYEFNPLDGVTLQQRYDTEGWAYWVGNRKGQDTDEQPQFVMSALGGTLWERPSPQQAQR